MLSKVQKNRAFRHDLLLAIVPALLWAVLFMLRPYFYTAWCSVNPSPCVPESVNAFDRIVFQFGIVRADYWSNVVQNVTGALTCLLPFLIYFKRSWQTAFRELWLFATIAMWNGVGLEVARLLIQRPRPMVFHDPLTSGLNINQYTSFYSGHTSFVALASLSMVFMIQRRFVNQPWIIRNFFVLFVSLTTLTGALRVIGGRHYPTDVIAGFAIGCALTVFFNRRLKRCLTPF